MHGEEGLSDDFQGGRRYESWKFYQEEFGEFSSIEDPLITWVQSLLVETLNRGHL